MFLPPDGGQALGTNAASFCDVTSGLLGFFLWRDAAIVLMPPGEHIAFDDLAVLSTRADPQKLQTLVETAKATGTKLTQPLLCKHSTFALFHHPRKG